MKQGLTVGAKAPDFTLTDTRGKRVRLYDQKTDFVLVVFMRYAGCPWCNLAIHRLTLEYPLLKQNHCGIIAFIESSTENIEDAIYRRHAKKPQFPIIADPERKSYAQYGVFPSLPLTIKHLAHIPAWVRAVKGGYPQTAVDGNLFLVPAHFLVSMKTKKIVDVSYAADFYEHETFTRIYEKLYFDD